MLNGNKQFDISSSSFSSSFFLIQDNILHNAIVVRNAEISSLNLNI